MKGTILALLGLLLAAGPEAVNAQFVYTTNAGAITITGYTGFGGAVAIPTSINGLPVTSIGNDAFEYITNLNSVEIPAGVTNLGEYAFYHCDSMTGVFFEGNAPTADSTAFACDSCPTLYYLPGTTGWASWGSQADETQYVYSGTVGLGYENYLCGAATIPTNINGFLVTSIGSDAFAYSPFLSSVTIPATVTNIGVGAFYDCSGLTNVTIDDGATNIGDYAFYGCLGLTKVTIPANVTNIGVSAFGCCSGLAGVSIPASVVGLGNQVFADCANLTAISVDPQNLFYSSVNGVLFNQSLTTLVEYPAGAGGSYAIPATVTDIADYAFYDCANLASVTIPGSVTSIGKFAFWDFSGLTGLYFAGNAPSTVGSDILYTNNVTAWYLPCATGWSNTFAGVPAVLWNPLIQAGGSSFGISNGNFGFNITNTVNPTVVVEACTNLANPVWTPLQTLTLSNGVSYFSEPLQTNASGRFYGLGFP
jgi:hypothetical protein